MPNKPFRVGFSADFFDENRQPVFPDIGLSLLEGMPGVEHVFLPSYHAEYAPGQLEGLDVLISLKPRVTAASLQGVERLCAIGRCGVGYDNVDLGACTDQDIAVYITPAGVTRPMAESIVLLVLALSHNLVVKDRLVRQGCWVESTRPLGREPRGKTIGVIGLGNIGREVVRLLSSFDVGRFLAFDPFLSSEQLRTLRVESASLDDLLRLSDYVLINCPLNKSTYHMVGERELRLMKREAVLVNTARGPIVDENALIRALQEGWIRAAALDVFEKEPLDTSSPLLRLENVILTSHSVGWTEELFRDMGRLDCEGALAVMRGQPPMNVVNAEVLDRPGFRRKLELYRERGIPMTNTLKEKLKRGETVYGQLLLELFTPGVPQILANCGLDFVLFDMEHGRCDLALAAEMINCARGADIAPVVRVPDAGFCPLSRLLDLGALGLMVPRVETGEQMRDIVSQLKYAPAGRRGVALGVAHDLYRPQGTSYFEIANDQTIVIGLVETERAFENLDDIVSTPGLDVAWMGHYDLTVSMGIPAQFDHPRFLERMDQLLACCQRHGVMPGFLPGNATETLHWVKKGFRVISLGTDIGVYQGALRAFHDAANAQLGASAG